MKSLLSITLLLFISSGAFCAPAQRTQRDVSEIAPPAYNYLPPDAQLNLPEATTTTTEVAETEAPATETEMAGVPPPSAALSDNGYEYRTVRRLRFRQRVRRDVSHLASQYLPPSKKYLPPGQQNAAEDVSVKMSPANDYLPPAEDIANIDATETPEAPAMELMEQETEAPATEAAETEAPEEMPEEMPIQDTAVLAADGYHYKQPAEEMPMPGEYLPPLTKEQTEAEGPEETAVLADDGYHYRAIKRLKF